MPALPFPTQSSVSRGSPPFTRMKVENVDNGAVTVYFSRDTVKKLEPKANQSAEEAVTVEVEG